MKTLVSAEGIARHYIQDGADRYVSYRKFQSIGQEEQQGKSQQQLANELGINRGTLYHWLRGKRPYSVHTIDGLIERNLVPLKTDSPTLGVITYAAGLNWHSGSLSVGIDGYASAIPDFFLNEPLHLDEIAQKLDLELQVSEVSNGTCLRYKLPAGIAYILSELGLPLQERKTSVEYAYPKFLNILTEEGDWDRIRLFLGTQLLTRSFADKNVQVIYNVAKHSKTLAFQLGEDVLALYKKAFLQYNFPKLGISHNPRDKLYSTLIRISKNVSDAIIKSTHQSVRNELQHISR